MTGTVCFSESTCKMDYNAGKLLVFVTARRAIYDYTTKECSNQEITDQLWNLVSYY
jgi:hypothetical protein